MNAFEEATLSALKKITGNNSYSEETFFTKGEDGNLAPKEKSVIEKLIMDDYRKKHDGLGTINEEKKKTIEQAAKKSVYEKLEAEATELGIENFKVNDGGIKAVFNAGSDSALKSGKKPEGFDIKKEQEYIDLKEKLRIEKEAHAKSKQDSLKSRINDKMFGLLTPLLRDENNKFVIPDNETVLSNNLETAFNKMPLGEGRLIFEEDGRTLKYVDKDGYDITDDDGNKVTPKSLALKGLKAAFVQNANSRSKSAGSTDKNRPTNTPAAAKSFAYKKGDNTEASFSLPSNVTTKKAGYQWLNLNRSKIPTSELRNEIRTHIDSLPKE